MREIQYSKIVYIHFQLFHKVESINSKEKESEGNGEGEREVHQVE